MRNWIDLTRPIVEGMSVYPGDPLFQSRPFADHAADGYRGTKLTLGTHLGTHIDAPFHYFCDGETLDSFPVDFFFGSAAVVDLTPLIGVGSDRFEGRTPGRPAAIGCDDLEGFAPLFERYPIIFLRTGWASRFHARDYYTDFPSLSPATCDWIADFPTLRILGLETPSLASFPELGGTSDTELALKTFDPELTEFLPDAAFTAASSAADAGTSEDETPLDELELHADAECHRILLGRRPPILILEGLVNLELLPSYGVVDLVGERVALDESRELEAACLPLNIAGIDGCPVRAAARLAR